MNLGQEKMRLLWAGEWPLWQTAGVALLLVLIAAWIYLGEAKRGTSGRLRWVLPSLRCIALVALVLTLAGPVLRLQKEDGNRGKITIFLDSSESMDLKDKNYSPGRKILLAKEHGFLPEESDLIDYRFATASRRMESLAELLRKGENKNQEDDDMKIIREKLSSVLKILDPLEDAFTKKTKADSLLEELWFNLGGDKWEDLQKNSKFTGENPDQFSYLSSLETKRNIGDSYGRKISAFLTPQKTESIPFGSCQMIHRSYK